ncbi:type I polyketide synthase [Actinomadura fibrosa]|uniref:Type I polyketide synthase n=1 Tax=Actinomadura fibrosa TaxID=111802 RepID=A0ABW2Y290_9ACTN|nr:type I polyketide synthase [Actinomadura fibrosa]
MSGERTAVVGMACRYPDAASPGELWENAVAGRRAFRRLPGERMRLEDYWDADPSAPDRFYARYAAVIEGYAFDRTAHRIAGSTYRSTDLTHWLALDVAGRALADAGFPEGEGLPRDRTAVIVGNTLTGDRTRANLMRLRWPYVHRVVAAVLTEREGWSGHRLDGFLADLERAYKEPFPPVDEDTLAGGLSNTIAGRVCNHFDLGGGGYTVDGACASSLLSVTAACRSLLAGEADAAVAGGVDLSIDPFEIVGFAKAGALAREEMRLYDRRSNGFWPGEGCGMVVLMREADARAQGRPVYATVAGWGISSDGHGGITRPDARGYRLALRRAYEHAGFGIGTVPLFEGHGTGTPVGDEVELRALSEARREASAGAAPAAIGSIKAVIGHTKAAAGVAGFIKAVMAVRHRLLPPTIGCGDPHPVLDEEPAVLRVLAKAEPWPDGAPPRAGVTAMGFGGINSHVVLEGVEGSGGSRPRDGMPGACGEALVSAVQDVELLLIDGDTPGVLRERLTELASFVPRLSYAQLADLAAVLYGDLRDRPHRAALVVSSPEDAERGLRRVIEALDSGESGHASADGRTFLGHAGGTGRIGLLFPGQGSGGGTGGGALRRRFAEVEEVYERADLPAGGDMAATEVAQPRIATGSLAGLRALSLFGLEGSVAVGHSLGEITALHWAGAMDAEALLRVVGLRGAAMAEHALPGGMIGLSAPPGAAAALAAGRPVTIAGYNGPRHTVVSGTIDDLDELGREAGRSGVGWTRLPVSHAFHSPLVAPAAEAFAAALAEERFGGVARRTVSTVTGADLPADADLRGHLRRQIVEPVLFARAVELAAKEVDLFVEVGPGRVLCHLAAQTTDVPALPLDVEDESLGRLCAAMAAAYVIGAPMRFDALFRGRLVRPLRIGAEFSFFSSPCESAPLVAESARPGVGAEPEPARPASARPSAACPALGGRGAGGDPEPTVELLRRLLAERVELPPEMVTEESRPLDGLHLSSIAVGEIMNRAALSLDLPAVQAPSGFATATVRELAAVLDTMAATAQPGDRGRGQAVAGAAAWARSFAVVLDPRPLPARRAREAAGRWQAHAAPGHPLAEPLREALERARVGDGVLVCLGGGCPEEWPGLALRGAQQAQRLAAGGRFVLVQEDLGAAALARTLRQESPDLHVTIVHTPLTGGAVRRVVDEVAATSGFAEAHYDGDGARTVPTLCALPVRPERTDMPLDASDVVLATGGGKGITAECALALALGTGARLALVGRADPAADEELAANLRRMADAGADVRYARADVGDGDRVRAAVAELSEALGPVTAVLHGAGRNEPAPLAALDAAAFHRALAPKAGGLRTVLGAVDPGRLRLLVTFGSIIGRAGLRGEAHYAVANERLADLTRAFAAGHPHCRTVCMEWSVWSGVGMGERLAVVEALERDGVTAVTPRQGVEIMRRLVADPDVPPVVVVSGRTGAADTVRHDLPELPLLRFAGRPLLRYHGVELVTEVELNVGSDPYLADHALDGSLVFPAVMGMEAMAQAAAAVTGRRTTPVFEQVGFTRPIVVPARGGTTIRLAATVVDDDAVRVAIRSSETGFSADHFTALLVYTDERPPAGASRGCGDGLPAVALDPASELYGSVLFQGARFHRLGRYRRAAARHVDAEVTAVPAGSSPGWFARFLPEAMVLADPGMRDALMHGNQVCVPDATLLPSGVERVWPAGPRVSGELRFCATERERDGDTYVYDVAVRDADGTLVERWEGLRLRAVRKGDGRGPWTAPLLGPYLEREVEERTGARMAVAVEPDGEAGGGVEARRARTALAAERALGHPVRIRYRPDGRPELADGRTISAAHGAGATLCVVAGGTAACDIEAVAERSGPAWEGLLGRHAPLARLIAAENADGHDTAATRVWSAIECLRKAEVPAGAPLTLTPHSGGAWVVLASGPVRIATLATTVRGRPGRVVIAVLAEGRS